MKETRHTQEEIDHWRARILGTNVPRDMLTGLKSNIDPLPYEDTVADSVIIAVVSFLTGLGAGIAIMVLKRWLHG